MNLKKVTKKSADGSSISYEFDVPKVPQVSNVPDHPGEPKGTDTVPAWLTPGEYVVNAEATRMFEPQIEAMNEVGRSVQRAQGGSIPEYHEDGGVAGISDDNRDMDSRMADLINQFGTDTVMQNINAIQQRDPNFNTSSLVSSLNNIESQVPSVTEVPFTNNSQSPDDVPMELSGIDINSLLAQQESEKDANKTGYLQNLLSGDMPLATSNAAAVSNLSPQDRIEALVDNPVTNFLPKISINTSGLEGILPESDTVANVDKTPLVDKDGNEQVASDLQSDKSREELDTILKDEEAAAEAARIDEEKANEAAIDYLNQMAELEGDGTGDDKSTGDIYTGSLGDKAMGMLSSIGSFFKDNFSDLIDDDKLKSAALMYLGSRAMGYSHAGSLNFVGKRYLGQIDRKLKVADQAALTNKYTKDSIKKYRDTGNVEDLKMIGNVQMVGSEMLVDDKGRQVRINKYEDKNSGKTIYQTEDGKPVNRAKFRTQAEANSASDRVVKGSSSIFKGNMDKIRNVDPEKAARLQTLLPTDEAFGMALDRVGVKYGLSPSLINSKAEVLSNNMIDYADKTGQKLSADVVEGFLNKEFLTASLSNMGISKMLDGADQDTIEVLNSKISKDPIELASEYKRYAKEYNDLKDKKKQYERKSPEGTTGFITYIIEQLEAKNKQ